MMDWCNTVAHLKLSPLLYSTPDAMKCYALQYASVSATCAQEDWKTKVYLEFRQYGDDIHKLLLYGFMKALIWINFKENVLLQPVAESKAWCLLLLLTFVWKQSGRVHTCSHGIKRLTGGLFLTLMFIPSSALSPQATEKHCGLFNSAVYWW